MNRLEVITISFSGGQKKTLRVGHVVPVGDGYSSALNAGSIQVISKSSLGKILSLSSILHFQATATSATSPQSSQHQ